jgi:hypothetical protein
MGANVTGRVAGKNEALCLSNSSYATLHDVLEIAGSRLARSAWEKYWALWLVTHDLGAFGHNFADYDIGEMPWEHAPFDDEKAFLIHLVDAARARLGWEVLGYDPAYAVRYLEGYRRLAAAAEPTEVVPPQRSFRLDPPDNYDVCPHDGMLMHTVGCRLCYEP